MRMLWPQHPSRGGYRAARRLTRAYVVREDRAVPAGYGPAAREGLIMSTNIFVNLPTTDLDRATQFYTALGFTINPLFTDENAACVVVSDEIYVMVLTREYFATFTDKQVTDARTHAQALIALSRDTRADVDAIVDAGLAAGGTEPRPGQDYGFMYSRDLEDPDGNILEFLYMDPAAAEAGPEAYMAAQDQS
jgi:predicted lactoylglutathione lyase